MRNDEHAGPWWEQRCQALFLLSYCAGAPVSPRPAMRCPWRWPKPPCRLCSIRHSLFRRLSDGCRFRTRRGHIPCLTACHVRARSAVRFPLRAPDHRVRATSWVVPRTSGQVDVCIARRRLAHMGRTSASLFCACRRAAVSIIPFVLRDAGKWSSMYHVCVQQGTRLLPCLPSLSVYQACRPPRSWRSCSATRGCCRRCDRLSAPQQWRSSRRRSRRHPAPIADEHDDDSPPALALSSKIAC